MDVDVSEGDTVQWCFSSLDRNIDFKVDFITQDQVVHTVVPHCHVQSMGSLVRGEWTANAVGVIRLVFDNTQSSWRACSVSYEITIVKPGEHVVDWSICGTNKSLSHHNYNRCVFCAVRYLPYTIIITTPTTITTRANGIIQAALLRFTAAFSD